MSLAPSWRAWLSGRRGALLQMSLIVIGALALPGNWWPSPLVLAAVATTLILLTGDDWRAAGFGRAGRPAFWWVLTAVAIGGLWQYATAGVLAPLASRLLNSPANPAPVPAGPLGLAFSVAVFILLQPLTKALVYRGFLLNRLERVFGTHLAGAAVSWLVASIIFGLSSWREGPAAVVVGTATGAVFNSLYYWAKRSVWPSVLAHAVYNGVALTLLYLGQL